jgi:hypothetical protein
MRGAQKASSPSNAAITYRFSKIQRRSAHKAEPRFAINNTAKRVIIFNELEIDWRQRERTLNVVFYLKFLKFCSE